jgi:hypothetical protein
MSKQAVAVVALCLSLAACGGTKRQTVRSTKAAFLTAVNRICAQAATPGGRVAKLRALHPPAGADELYVHWLRAEQDALEALTDRTGGSRDTGLDPALRIVIAHGKIAGYARRLGAEACERRAMGTLSP